MASSSAAFSSGRRHTETKRQRDTETQRHRDTETQRHTTLPYSAILRHCDANTHTQTETHKTHAVLTAVEMASSSAAFSSGNSTASS
eukprot:3439340-Rhodomonas_salina.1